jgi:hypothetical protein
MRQATQCNVNGRYQSSDGKASWLGFAVPEAQSGEEGLMAYYLTQKL